MKKLNELSIKEALVGLKSKEFTSYELVKACVEQIELVNNKIEAFITLTVQKALSEAKKADELIGQQGEKAFEIKPLLGILYTVKDIFSTKGVQTTAASNILKGYIPQYESTVTKRLNDAGAILLAKDNLDAFSHGGSTETSDFFTTKNPWDLTRLPGGSSGGTAAAVTANMTIFGIGGDTGGSIRCPVSWCGVTGLKPTYGRVSRYGVIAMASSTDCPGPITKTAEDAAFVLSIIAGKDQNDATTLIEKVPAYDKILERYGLKGVKIGKPRSYFDKEIDSDVLEKVENALTKFEQLGAEIIELDLLSPNYSLAIYTIVQRAEVSSNLARFDGIRYGHNRDTFGFEAKKRMMLGAYVLSVGYYDEYYAKAQKVRTVLIKDFKKAFETVDFIVGPTLPTVAQKIGANDTSPMFGELTDRLQTPASMAGLPSIAVPCGFSHGLPVGMQLTGNYTQEDKILGAAHVFQKNTDYHKITDSINLKMKEYK
ncbi:MAG: Asp-tRNA(Asn)/Glu-tRNA(Gln) amidotransferase subunit GatA [Paludibacteraceae bacterium]|nr:Asp-tRNA(Asn)/Glu-tRNA(Gln) amidotransferase subunit GatA [Paludibacteraceae bacterium]